MWTPTASSSRVAVEEKLAGPISWVAVEEKLNMDFAFWRSRYQSQPEEYRELVEGARMKVMDRGLATITIGKMEWELGPPSGYTGYCEKLQESAQEDWLLVSRSGFRVTLRSPRGTSGVLPVCPLQGEMAPALDGGVDMSGVVSRFFTLGEVDRPSKLRRTLSQKKREEIVGVKLGAPFLKCVNGVRNATDISDVLNTILGFSAVCSANEHVLQQVPEDPDLEDNYFYDIEGMDELRDFNAVRRDALSWVRQQARDAAMKCQAAAEATSEVARLTARMLLNKPEPAGDGEQEARDLMETDEELQIGGLSSSSKLEDDGLMGTPLRNEDSGPPKSDDDLIEFDDWEDRIDASRTPSGLNKQMGMETSSTTSWEFVRHVGEEDEILGAGISDAEGLHMMLRERDPFGCDDCSHLVDEFLNLSLGTAPSSSLSLQDQNTDGTEIRKKKVLKSLASWSSSSSGWSSSTARDGPSSVSKKFQPLQLKTLAEEPSVDPKTASACRSYVMRAAAKGDVLQWCSCKFNKSRSSIEMQFQVGSFMEDDIATLSTGISRRSPLRIEIFLKAMNVRQSLLEGRVRVSTDQGTPEWPWNEGTQSVIGLSCYIPHQVRQYLQQYIRERVENGYEFPGGELLTGLMKHVVASLVYLKHSCCVCNQQRLPDMIMSMVPKPCEQNLCQALHDLWLVVAPQMVVECSTVRNWLSTCFQEGVKADEELMLQYTGDPKYTWWKALSYDSKLENVMAWILETIVHGSWLQLVEENKHKSDQELQYRANLEAFPRLVDVSADSFETTLNCLKAWQSRLF